MDKNDMKHTFSNFTVNSSNVNAYREAIEFSLNYDDDRIIIKGPTGCGKSHLIESIFQNFTSSYKDLPCIRYDIHSLTKEIKNGLDFAKLEKMLNSSLIVIDDIDCVDKGLYGYLAKLFKKLIEHNNKIVLSVTNTDRLNTVIKNEFRIVEIFQTNNELFKSYLDRYLFNNNLVFEKEAKDYLINNYSKDFRSFLGSLSRLGYYLTTNNKNKVNFNLIKTIFE